MVLNIHSGIALDFMHVLLISQNNWLLNVTKHIGCAFGLRADCGERETDYNLFLLQFTLRKLT